MAIMVVALILVIVLTAIMTVRRIGVGHSEIQWEGNEKVFVPERVAERGTALDEAKKIINGARQDQYGNPEDNFKEIADYWSTYLGRNVNRVDVALMQAQLKIARIKTGVGTRDSYVDALGYIALAADMAQCER